MTLPGGVEIAGAVLLVVLVIGVVAGRARRRWTLLVVGLVVVVVAGSAVALATTPLRSGSADRVQEYAKVLSTVVPLAVAYAAGWVCGRGSWFLRIVVIGAAALLLAVFPYSVAAAGLARLLPR